MSRYHAFCHKSLCHSFGTLCAIRLALFVPNRSRNNYMTLSMSHSHMYVTFTTKIATNSFYYYIIYLFIITFQFFRKIFFFLLILFANFSILSFAGKGQNCPPVTGYWLLVLSVCSPIILPGS